MYFNLLQGAATAKMKTEYVKKKSNGGKLNVFVFSFPFLKQGFTPKLS